MKSKIVSVLICMAMLLSLLPALPIAAAQTVVFEDNFEAYERPQENGAHYGTKYVTLSNGKNAVKVVSSNDKFSFNASKYSLKQMREAGHNDMLESENVTYFYADYRNSAIGSNSCGPQLNDALKINEKHIEYSFIIEIM